MGNVHIAAQDELSLCLQLQQMGVELGQEAELGLLAFLAGGAAGKVGADQRQLAPGPIKAQLDVAPLGVELCGAIADDHVAGRVARVDAHARVALFFGKVKMALQARQLLKTALNVGGLGLELLHANTIRAVLLYPRLYALGRGRAYAVKVETG